jgi:serine protease AprX
MRANRPARQPPGSPSRHVLRWLALVTAASFVVLSLSLIGGAAAASASGSYDPSSDPYSMANLASQMGASSWWDAGYTGAGIDVAVIDTGLSAVPALSGANKIVYGPDLSITSQASNLVNLDAYGHGTFMAGLIAGHDSSLASPYSQASATSYRGIAPDARIVSVKVGSADGIADVTQVIAAIDWVVQHAHDPGFNIRAINLSYGTNSTQDYTVDPLAYAAEQAWKHGIVVVASAGNTGFQRGHGARGLADPAYDPYIIGVGAYDTNGTATSSDDTMGSYSASSGGCKDCKQPDFVAPGSHVQGLRVPGSYIDTSGQGILDASYIRGSGTSEAAAITSGAVALILQRYPNLTPDQVKAFIVADAQRVPGADPQRQGAGELDLTDMLTDAPQGYAVPVTTAAGSGPGKDGGRKGDGGRDDKAKPQSQSQAPVSLTDPIGPTAPPQHYRDSTGNGLLEASRGSDYLSKNNKQLANEVDIFGHPFDSRAMAAAEAAGNSWSGGTWNGNTWSGNSWSGNTWSGNTWSGNTWSGNTWSGNTWSGNTWSGNTWSGNTWSGNTWSGNTWSGNTWSGVSWSSASWG